MRMILAFLALATTALPGFAQEQASWQPIEKVEHYSITGQDGLSLYRSIGENGPQLGKSAVRVIAYTDFKLTWQRKYENPNGGCLLAAAKPKLVITYRLPKPKGALPGDLKARWDEFYSGIVKHERHHGDIIVDMVHQIEAASIGLAADNDPDCKKVRAELTRRLGEISRAERKQQSDFDRAEMTDGGTVHQLVLALVNGV